MCKVQSAKADSLVFFGFFFLGFLDELGEETCGEVNGGEKRNYIERGE